MKSRRLSERLVRWSQFLSQFNFKSKFWAGNQAERLDALSRRIQVTPKSLHDPRLTERDVKLMKDNWVSPFDFDKQESVLTSAIGETNHQTVLRSLYMKSC